MIDFPSLCVCVCLDLLLLCSYLLHGRGATRRQLRRLKRRCFFFLLMSVEFICIESLFFEHEKQSTSPSLPKVRLTVSFSSGKTSEIMCCAIAEEDVAVCVGVCTATRSPVDFPVTQEISFLCRISRGVFLSLFLHVIHTHRKRDYVSFVCVSVFAL